MSAVQTTGAKLAPETAEAHASTVIKYEKITLASGLRVLASQDKTIPFVHVGIWYHVGSRDERPGTDRLRPLVRAPAVQWFLVTWNRNKPHCISPALTGDMRWSVVKQMLSS
ncbi:hypothetical protein ACFSLT_31350 [Novosphingobium resinovorum]